MLMLAAVLPALAQERTYRLDVGRFDKIKITDNVNVVYRSVPDSTGMAVFTGAEEFANAFIFTNSKEAPHSGEHGGCQQPRVACAVCIFGLSD